MDHEESARAVTSNIELAGGIIRYAGDCWSLRNFLLASKVFAAAFRAPYIQGQWLMETFPPELRYRVACTSCQSIPVVQWLLEQHVPVQGCDEADEDWNSICEVIHLAAKHNCLAVVDAMVKAGATAEDKFSALEAAATEGHLDVVMLLLPSCECSQEEAVLHALLRASEGGQTALMSTLLPMGESKPGWRQMCAPAVIGAAQYGHEAAVNLLLDYGIPCMATDNRSPLWTATCHGQHGVAKLLLERGAVVPDLAQDVGKSMAIAVELNRLECATLLLDYGADVHWTFSPAHVQDGSPLTVAAVNGHAEMVELLISRGANVEGRPGSSQLVDPTWITPLLKAAKKGHFQVVQALVSHGANVEAQDQNEDNSLTWAAWYGFNDIVEHLLDHGAAIEGGGRKFGTALVNAARKHQTSTCELLLKRGAFADATDKGGDTALTWAAASTNADLVELLLNHGATVNHQRKDGNTALIQAAAYAAVMVVRVLLKHKADINLANWDGTTPLMAAVNEGHTEVVQELLQHGDLNVDIKWEDLIISAASKGYDKVVVLVLQYMEQHPTLQGSNKWAAALQQAAAQGRVAVARELLMHGASCDAAEDMESPLFAAIHGGHIETMNMLLDHGAQVTSRSKDGSTPLTMVARLSGHLAGSVTAMITVLLARGAKVDEVDEDGRTPLRLAAEHRHEGAVALLLQHGADPNAADKDGITPLLAALQPVDILPMYYEVVPLLLGNGADVNKAANDGTTPLLAACKNPTSSAVIQALVQCGAGLDVVDKDGNTPLLLAVQARSEIIIDLLLSSGCNMTHRNNHGETALWIAASQHSFHVVHRLATAGADQRPNEDGVTPLLAACYRAAGAHSTTAVLITLVEYGADVNAPSKAGDTPLLVACNQGWDEAVAFLLESGASVQTRNKDGSTPLHMAACATGPDMGELVQRLLDNGADASAVDQEGRSALLIACQAGTFATVVALLDATPRHLLDATDRDGSKPLCALALRNPFNELRGVDVHTLEACVAKMLQLGVDPNTTTKAGRTPLMNAAATGNTALLDLLLQAGADASLLDEDGHTALYFAATGRHTSMVRALLAHDSAVAKDAAAIEACADMVVVAAKDGDAQFVELLAKHGVRLEGCDKFGDNALTWAAWAGHDEVVQVLLDHGVDIESGTKGFNTIGSALHNAATRDHGHIVDILLDHGANIEAVNEDGKTALFVAAYSHHTAVTMRLLRALATDRCLAPEEVPRKLATKKEEVTRCWQGVSATILEALQLLEVEAAEEMAADDEYMAWLQKAIVVFGHPHHPPAV